MWLNKFLPKKKYYIHALLGYSASSYTRLGPYRFKWVAYSKAHWVMSNNPWGCAQITASPEQPEIVND